MSELDSSWPPHTDGLVWAGICLGGALPLLAWGLGVSFWWAGEAGFVATNPAAWAVLQPVLAAAMWLRRGAPFTVAMWLQLPVGLALMFSLLQAPAAFVAVGRGGALAGQSYQALGLSYALALATGAIFTGLGAYLLRISLRRP